MGGTQTQEMAVFCGFCASFHVSSYCMMTKERTSALMFQNFEKLWYVSKSSIFNKVALWGSNSITNEFLFFKVFNRSTELKAYSELCQTSKMSGFAWIFIGFLVVNFFRNRLRLKYLPGFWMRLWNSLVVDKSLVELLFFFFENSFYWRIMCKLKHFLKVIRLHRFPFQHCRGVWVFSDQNLLHAVRAITCYKIRWLKPRCAMWSKSEYLYREEDFWEQLNTFQAGASVSGFISWTTFNKYT